LLDASLGHDLEQQVDLPLDGLHASGRPVDRLL
jgi:hypothetical protein